MVMSSLYEELLDLLPIILAHQKIARKSTSNNWRDDCKGGDDCLLIAMLAGGSFRCGANSYFSYFNLIYLLHRASIYLVPLFQKPDSLDKERDIRHRTFSSRQPRTAQLGDTDLLHKKHPFKSGLRFLYGPFLRVRKWHFHFLEWPFLHFQRHFRRPQRKSRNTFISNKPPN